MKYKRIFIALVCIIFLATNCSTIISASEVKTPGTYNMEFNASLSNSVIASIPSGLKFTGINPKMESNVTVKGDLEAGYEAKIIPNYNVQLKYVSESNILFDERLNTCYAFTKQEKQSWTEEELRKAGKDKFAEYAVTTLSLDEELRPGTYKGALGYTVSIEQTKPKGAIEGKKYTEVLNGITWNAIGIDNGYLRIVSSSKTNEFNNSWALTHTGELNIPDYIDGYTIADVEDGAFKDCTGITSVKYPKYCQSVGVSNFEGCSNLEKITFSDGTGYSDFDDILMIQAKAFKNCVKLKDIEVPNRVHFFDTECFYNCPNIANINVTDNQYLNVRPGAFYGVQNITYSGSLAGAPWGANALNGVMQPN